MKTLKTIALLCTSLMAVEVAANNLVIYPAEGQSQKQQEQDEFECYKWAKERTGFDPMEQPHASSPPPTDNASSTGRGLLGGALLGAAIGGIADGGKGAGKGAAIGGLLGGMRSRGQQQEHEQNREQWAQKEAYRYQEQRNQYDRSVAACLDARGYSVN